jgi:hypothetical protein
MTIQSTRTTLPGVIKLAKSDSPKDGNGGPGEEGMGPAKTAPAINIVANAAIHKRDNVRIVFILLS